MYLLLARVGLISLRHVNQRLVAQAAGCNFYSPLTFWNVARHPGRSPQAGLYRDGRNSRRPAHSCAACPAPDPHCITTDLEMVSRSNGAAEQLHTQGRRLRNLSKGARETGERSSTFC